MIYRTSVVGKSIVTKQFPSTMDLYWFIVEDNVVVNPFDFVSVDNINNSVSIGIIKDIQSVVVNENPFLFDMLRQGPNDHSDNISIGEKRDKKSQSSHVENISTVMTVAKVIIIANTGEQNFEDKKMDDNISSS